MTAPVDYIIVSLDGAGITLFKKLLCADNKENSQIDVKHIGPQAFSSLFNQEIKPSTVFLFTFPKNRRKHFDALTAMWDTSNDHAVPAEQIEGIKSRSLLVMMTTGLDGSNDVTDEEDFALHRGLRFVKVYLKGKEGREELFQAINKLVPGAFPSSTPRGASSGSTTFTSGRTPTRSTKLRATELGTKLINCMESELHNDRYLLLGAYYKFTTDSELFDAFKRKLSELDTSFRHPRIDRNACMGALTRCLKLLEDWVWIKYPLKSARLLSQIHDLVQPIAHHEGYASSVRNAASAVGVAAVTMAAAPSQPPTVAADGGTAVPPQPLAVGQKPLWRLYEDSPAMLAQDLMYLSTLRFTAIAPSELYDIKWTKPERSIAAPNVVEALQFSRTIERIVETEVLTGAKRKECRAAMKFWQEVLWIARERRHYDVFCSVCGGLSMSTVARVFGEDLQYVLGPHHVDIAADWDMWKMSAQWLRGFVEPALQAQRPIQPFVQQLFSVYERAGVSANAAENPLQSAEAFTRKYVVPFVQIQRLARMVQSTPSSKMAAITQYTPLSEDEIAKVSDALVEKLKAKAARRRHSFDATSALQRLERKCQAVVEAIDEPSRLTSLTSYLGKIRNDVRICTVDVRAKIFGQLLKVMLRLDSTTVLRQLATDEREQGPIGQFVRELFSLFGPMLIGDIAVMEQALSHWVQLDEERKRGNVAPEYDQRVRELFESVIRSAFVFTSDEFDNLIAAVRRKAQELVGMMHELPAPSFSAESIVALLAAFDKAQDSIGACSQVIGYLEQERYVPNVASQVQQSIEASEQGMAHIAKVQQQAMNAIERIHAETVPIEAELEQVIAKRKELEEALAQIKRREVELSEARVALVQERRKVEQHALLECHLLTTQAQGELYSIHAATLAEQCIAELDRLLCQRACIPAASIDPALESLMLQATRALQCLRATLDDERTKLGEIAAAHRKGASRRASLAQQIAADSALRQTQWESIKSRVAEYGKTYNSLKERVSSLLGQLTLEAAVPKVWFASAKGIVASELQDVMSQVEALLNEIAGAKMDNK